MIIIKLEDAPNLDEVATKAQADTYRLIKASFEAKQRVTVADLLEKLGLQNPAPFFSRLNHLQEKGLLKWGKPQIQTA